jgi:hypothetical protein
VNVSLALTLFKIAVTIIAAIQNSAVYQQGRKAAYADMDDEQKARLALAEAARADADIFADGSVHDPRQRD